VVLVFDGRLRFVPAIALVLGSLLGMAGTFTSSPGIRGLAWGIDGTLLVVAAAMLAVHHLRSGDGVLAAGFLVFLAGETLIVSGSAMDLAASAPIFAAGSGLWTAALLLTSASRALPSFVRATGAIAAILFAIGAAMIYSGSPLTPLSKPLPFAAYPFLALTLLGWAWAHRNSPTTK
jgi:hypothetical protein